MIGIEGLLQEYEKGTDMKQVLYAIHKDPSKNLFEELGKMLPSDEDAAVQNSAAESLDAAEFHYALALRHCVGFHFECRSHLRETTAILRFSGGILNGGIFPPLRDAQGAIVSDDNCLDAIAQYKADYNMNSLWFDAYPATQWNGGDDWYNIVRSRMSEFFRIYKSICRPVGSLPTRPRGCQDTTKLANKYYLPPER
jgi:hypothetical protein